MSNYTHLPQNSPYPPPAQGYPSPNQAGYPPAGQGYPPAGQGYPPAGQGYPPSGPGYPPPTQGYPPPTQGYPPPTQGYPAQGQGYPAPGQGYPPQGQGYPAGAAAPPPGGPIPMYKGDIPTEDVNDDPNMAEPVEASAPPPELPQSFPGYSNIGFEEASLPPPAYEDVVREPPSREEFSQSAGLTFEDAKSALMEFVASNCCYGKGPAENMVLTDMQASSAFHYILESFCESRTSKWESKPYSGGPIIMTGPPPGPWDISVPVPQMFKDAKMMVEVPNTSNVKPCHSCFGRGYKRCYRCHGRGRLRCTFCHGTGRRRQADGDSTRCITCGGDGRKRCYTCHGYGQTKCNMCKGNGQLRWFIQLTVKWKNHDDDHIVERTALPPKLIKDVAGKTALKEIALRVYPINHFPEQEINQASSEMVAKHANKWPAERMLQQQQSVRIIPVTNVSYTNSEKIGSFYIYGLENKVYFPDYPAQCCCGCSIL